MSRLPNAVVVSAVVLLGCVALAGTASALSVTVAQEDTEITVEVTQNGEPVRGASVTVSGVTRETPLDGEYTTDSSGRVRFSDDQTRQLSGVVHLRITVEGAGSYKSVLTTFTRSPEIGSSPMGHRMSMSFQESVAKTHGKVIGRLNSSGNSDVLKTARHVDYVLSNMSDVEFKREVLGRDLAAGEIEPTKFYLEAVKNARRGAVLRGILEEKIGYLNQQSDDRLRDNGIDPDDVENIVSELRQGRSVDTDRRLLE